MWSLRPNLNRKICEDLQEVRVFHYKRQGKNFMYRESKVTFNKNIKNRLFRRHLLNYDILLVTVCVSLWVWVLTPPCPLPLCSHLCVTGFPSPMNRSYWLQYTTVSNGLQKSTNVTPKRETVLTVSLLHDKSHVGQSLKHYRRTEESRLKLVDQFHHRRYKGVTLQR